MTGWLSCTILLFRLCFMRFVAAAYIREKDKIKVEEIYDNNNLSDIKRKPRTILNHGAFKYNDGERHSKQYRVDQFSHKNWLCRSGLQCSSFIRLKRKP